MTWLSRLVSLFPLSVLLLWLGSVYLLLRQPHWLNLLWPLLVLYLYPVLAFRLLNLCCPLQPGRYDLAARSYNAWWGSHQFQLIYFACPWLEGLLRLVPGLYSVWLRLWGAKVGKNIYWTPNIEIADRPLLQIGDDVIVGHKVQIISHVLIPYRQRLSLYVKAVEIGPQCFLGAGSRLGPGVVVEDGVQLPILTDGTINQRFSATDPKQTPGQMRRRQSKATNDNPGETVS